jgi:protein SCO1/2
MRRRWYALSVGAAALAGIWIGVAFHARLLGSAAAEPALPALHGQATWRAGQRAAPAFTLHDGTGRSVSLASLHGRTVVLAFLDSRCKQACPLEGRMLAASLREARGSGRPQLLVVSVNPAGDTSSSVVRASRTWGLPPGTIWLLGTRARLKPVWDAYQITVEPVAGDIVHSTAVYLLDRRGYERAGFLMPFVPGLVAHDLGVLGSEPA